MRKLDKEIDQLVKHPYGQTEDSYEMSLKGAVVVITKRMIMEEARCSRKITEFGVKGLEPESSFWFLSSVQVTSSLFASISLYVK